MIDTWSIIRTKQKSREQIILEYVLERLSSVKRELEDTSGLEIHLRALVHDAPSRFVQGAIAGGFRQVATERAQWVEQGFREAELTLFYEGGERP